MPDNLCSAFWMDRQFMPAAMRADLARLGWDPRGKWTYAAAARFLRRKLPAWN